jgi:hypothetical protein
MRLQATLHPSTAALSAVVVTACASIGSLSDASAWGK